jgi:enamine deaminase RidA (YjgF/YER057c/UK114 family)
VRTGNLLFIAGQLPRGEAGLITGKLGAPLSIEEGYVAARQATLNALAIAAHVLAGSASDPLKGLERVSQVVKVTGYINSAPGFTQQPQVLNGASDLLVALFGERGRHARVAVGVSELPLNAAVEVELLVEVRD